MVFSCFRDWASNAWASELANAAAGEGVSPPGHEPSGFAFADPDYVLAILEAAGWNRAEPHAVDFTYLAGVGPGAVENALAYLAEIGPASRIVQSLPDHERTDALERMRRVIERQFDGDKVAFPAAAWIWRAVAA